MRGAAPFITRRGAHISRPMTSAGHTHTHRQGSLDNSLHFRGTKAWLSQTSIGWKPRTCFLPQLLSSSHPRCQSKAQSHSFLRG